MNWGRKVVREYYSNGILKTVSTFKGSKRDGITKQYYDNGAIKIEANFKEGKPDGKCRQYYDDSTMMAEELYRNGILLIQKKYDRKGQLSDLAREYYETGAIKIEISFRAGKPEGLSREYYDDGALMAEELYRNGALVSQKRFDRAGRLEGIVKEYYENGSLRTETDYGIGMYKEYYREGGIKQQACFKEGRPHGLVKEYFGSGTLAAEDDYDEGKLVGSRRFDPAGSMTSSTGTLSEKEAIKEEKPAERETFEDYFKEIESAPAGDLKAIEPSVVEVKEETPPAKVETEPPKKVIKEKKAKKVELPPPPPAPEPPRETIEKIKSKAQEKEALERSFEEKFIRELEQIEPARVSEEKPEPIKEEAKAPEPQVIIEEQPKSVIEEIPAIEENIPQAAAPMEEEKKAFRPPIEEPAGSEMSGDVIKESFKGGALKAEISTRNGKRHGLTREYYETGELMAELEYNEGEVVSQVRYDKTGRFFYKFRKKQSE